MSMINDKTGHIVSDKEFQNHLRDILERKGRIILQAPCRPEIGEVQDFAGLPMRCIRYATYKEALENHIGAPLDTEKPTKGHFFFEVEVAD